MGEKRTGLIYCATNKVNGKMYIGQTTGGVNYRKSTHYFNSFLRKPRVHFHKAIKKYGKTAFSWRVLEDNIPIDELPAVEILYIDLFGTFLSSNGYNMTHGGEGACGRYPSKESKKKMAVSSTGIRPSEETKQKIRIANTGKKRSEAVLKNMRGSYTEERRKAASKRMSGKNNSMYGKKGVLAPCYGRIGDKHPMYGTHRTDVFKDAIGRSILQYEKDGTFIKEWSRVKLASDVTGADSSSIIRVCQGVQQASRGFVWRYKDNNFPIEEYVVRHPSHAVLQYTLDGMFIAEYSSFVEAAKVVGVGAGSISHVCKGSYKTAGGFMWKSKDK